MSIIVAHDAIHDNIRFLPPGQVAGYTTGTPNIRWTNADWAAHPGAVRIDQDFNAMDHSADVLDVERGAATFADCPIWAKQALGDFAAAVRPGQRKPTIYCSASNATPVVNSLIAGGVKSGVNLYVASWGIGEAAAMAKLASAGGPFPIVGVQYNNGPLFDFDVFDGGWLNDVSGNINPVHGLRVTKNGFTGIDIAWDAAPGATGYTAKALRGTTVAALTETTVTSCRLHRLSPLHTYTITVRAHPGHSLGFDATMTAKTK